MTARIYVTLKSGVLDPQGQAVQRALGRLGFAEVSDARIGKFIEIKLDGEAGAGAAATHSARIEQMCKDLLANPVIEDYRFEIVE